MKENTRLEQQSKTLQKEHVRQREMLAEAEKETVRLTALLRRTEEREAQLKQDLKDRAEEVAMNQLRDRNRNLPYVFFEKKHFCLKNLPEHRCVCHICGEESRPEPAREPAGLQGASLDPVMQVEQPGAGGMIERVGAGEAALLQELKRCQEEHSAALLSLK